MPGNARKIKTQTIKYNNMEKNLAEEFRKRIDNMSDEELNQKLKELEPLHNVGPKADDYLEFLEENKQKFKKGDFLKDEFGNIFICSEAYKTCWENEYLGIAFCVLFNNMMFTDKDWIWRSCLVSHATEEEKQKLIKAINDNGYVWGMCRGLMLDGVNHIVMEDLDNGFGRCYVKDKDNNDINYNRKVKFLGLSSLKDEVEHIARKYGIALSIVHASYTSKMCPICGCIDDDNRPNQETFECIECGHKDNADFNAAKNIRDRVTVTVLRDSLLKRRDNKSFEPKRLKRERVKEVLLSFRRDLLKASGECSEIINLNTFDYV